METSILAIKKRDRENYTQLEWRRTEHISRENIERWSRFVTEWQTRDGKTKDGKMTCKK